MNQSAPPSSTVLPKEHSSQLPSNEPCSNFPLRLLALRATIKGAFSKAAPSALVKQIFLRASAVEKTMIIVPAIVGTIILLSCQESSWAQFAAILGCLLSSISFRDALKAYWKSVIREDFVEGLSVPEALQSLRILTFWNEVQREQNWDENDFKLIVPLLEKESNLDRGIVTTHPSYLVAGSVLATGSGVLLGNLSAENLWVPASVMLLAGLFILFLFMCRDWIFSGERKRRELLLFLQYGAHGTPHPLPAHS